MIFFINGRSTYWGPNHPPLIENSTNFISINPSLNYCFGFIHYGSFIYHGKPFLPFLEHPLVINHNIFPVHHHILIAVWQILNMFGLGTYKYYAIIFEDLPDPLPPKRKPNICTQKNALKGTLSLRFLFPYIKNLDPLNTVNTVNKLVLPPNPYKNA